ncbi:MAG: hypothetical protein ACK486_16935 [Cyanobacteriota bacterium]
MPPFSLPLTLPPLLGRLPGAAQRRRTIVVVVVAMLVFLLRPLPPLAALPGWVVGGLLLWAALELLRWLWRPRRWS